MSKVAISVEGFIATELEFRDAGQHRVVQVLVAHTPSKKVDGQYVEEKEKTVWFAAEFWNEHAETVTHMAQKDTLVLLKGSVELELFMRKDQTPGGRVKITNPTIAVIVPRPKRGQQASNGAQGASGTDQWVPSTPAAQTGADVWNEPAGYGQESPF